MKSLLLAALSLALLSNACKKGKSSSNDLVGSWKMSETIRIGMIDWDKVNPSAEVVLTFNNDNTYTSVPPLISSVAACTGTYRIEAGNLLFMNCQTNPIYEEQFKFTRDGNTLILDHLMSSSGLRARYKKQ